MLCLLNTDLLYPAPHPTKELRAQGLAIRRALLCSLSHTSPIPPYLSEQSTTKLYIYKAWTAHSPRATQTSYSCTATPRSMAIRDNTARQSCLFHGAQVNWECLGACDWRQGGVHGNPWLPIRPCLRARFGDTDFSPHLSCLRRKLSFKREQTDHL